MEPARNAGSNGLVGARRASTGRAPSTDVGPMETLELQRRRAAQRENDAVACCLPSMSSITAARTSRASDNLQGRCPCWKGAAWGVLRARRTKVPDRATPTDKGRSCLRPPPVPPDASCSGRSGRGLGRDPQPSAGGADRDRASPERDPPESSRVSLRDLVHVPASRSRRRLGRAQVHGDGPLSSPR